MWGELNLPPGLDYDRCCGVSHDARSWNPDPGHQILTSEDLCLMEGVVCVD